MTENTTVKIESQASPTTTIGTTMTAEEHRPLNVKDALGYLDKVKAKFSSHSDVYNQFLDIMKDFKSQM
jgi:paired amphipathic helix protein Sin3a